jgi:rSAM/selenodomain-associated transferase 1
VVARVAVMEAYGRGRRSVTRGEFEWACNQVAIPDVSLLASRWLRADPAQPVFERRRQGSRHVDLTQARRTFMTGVTHAGETSARPVATHGVAVMAKASRPGLTKTRLCPPLTFDEAAVLNTAFLNDVAANVARSGEGRSVALHMAFGPPGAEAFFARKVPGDYGLIETWAPNFGDCLWTAIDRMFDAGHATACVLNSDSPTLPASLLGEMYDALERTGDRAVLGPSTDGGYYLLALKVRHRRLFEDIAWSTAEVARQTLERAGEIGLDMVVLPPWYDVDDAASLATLAGECLFDRPFSALAPSPAPAATEALRRLMRTADGARRLGFATPDEVFS